MDLNFSKEEALILSSLSDRMKKSKDVWIAARKADANLRTVLELRARYEDDCFEIWTFLKTKGLEPKVRVMIPNLQEV